MEGNLNFSRDGVYFVSQSLEGGDSGCVAIQLTFGRAGADVIVEYSVFPEMGWKTVSLTRASISHPDVISGVLNGLQVRIRTTKMPIEAKFKQI